MALDQVHRYAHRPRHGTPARRRRVRVWIAVGCFLGFVAVAWVWAFHRGSAAVGSDVPVLTANPQPTRERPTDPGGMKVVDIDPLSYDSGRSPPKIENILPAPERPLPPPAAPPPAAAAPATVPPSAIAQGAAPASTNTAAATAMSAKSNPQPAPRLQPVAKSAAPASLEHVAALSRAAKPQPPRAKPVALREESKPRPEPKSFAVTSGSYRLQLASLRSAGDAHASEAKLRGRFGDMLGAVGFSVVPVDLPGRGTYYRVMAGPMSQGAAAHICDALRQRGAACLLAR